MRGPLYPLAAAAVAALLASASPVAADGAEPAKTAVTVLSKQTVTRLDALVLGERLWIPVDRLEEVCGFVLKQEGICDANSCYPVPDGKEWILERESKRYLDLSSFAAEIGQPMAFEAKGPIFSFAVAEGIPGAPLAGGIAPDFTLPNLEGKLVSLSDFRGKKVLIITWASW